MPGKVKAIKQRIPVLILPVNTVPVLVLGPVLKAHCGGRGAGGVEVGLGTMGRLQKSLFKKKKNEKHALDPGNLQHDHLLEMSLKFTHEKGSDTHISSIKRLMFTWW